jgi:hypothetical protein
VTDPGSLPVGTASAAEPHLSPTFVWIETNRRLDVAVAEFRAAQLAMSARFERLDEHGSRGVDLLRVEVKSLRDDVTEHERLHENSRKEQVAARRWLIGVVIALIVPLYPLLIWLITRGK